MEAGTENIIHEPLRGILSALASSELELGDGDLDIVPLFKAHL
jgi:hypothetical protein